MNKLERREAIIKTLPTLYGDSKLARDKFEKSLRYIEKGYLDSFFVIFAHQPKTITPYLYILIEGKIRVRVSIASFERSGESLECWDQSERIAPWLAICTAPVVYPPSEIKMRGFQGFRYSQMLF